MQIIYLTHTLYPKIYSSQKIQKKKKGVYHSIEIRRNTVFDFLGQMHDINDLGVLFDLFKRKHDIPISNELFILQLQDIELFSGVINT